MVAPSAVIKKTAKKALDGNRLQSILASSALVFVTIISFYVSSMLGTVGNGRLFLISFAAFMIFAVIPLFLGILRFFRRMLWEQRDEAVIIFHYFSSKELYKKAVKFSGSLILKIAVTTVMFLIPAIITQILGSDGIYRMLDVSMPIFASNLWLVSKLLTSIGLVISFFVCLRYYAAPFLFASSDSMDVLEALHMSVVMSRRTAFDYMFLILSFSLWIIFSLLVIPIVFILPYFISAYAVHCRFAVAQYNIVADKINFGADAPVYSVDE